MSKVILEIDNGIAKVTINNAGAMNALTREILEDLKQTFYKIDKDPEVVIAIITGAGDKAFVAGADLNDFVVLDPDGSQFMSNLGQEVCDAIANCSVPVIAAVNGLAFGGGMEIVLSCDIRLASDNAKFGQQEALWGIMPGWGGTQRLPRLIGHSDAMKIMLTGEAISAEDAYRVGLLSAVYPKGELMDKAYELAGKIVKNGPYNIRWIKRAVLAGTRVNPAGLALENELLGRCFTTGIPKKRAQKFLDAQK